ncbi:MAG: IS4 family transposase [Alphaproteobacteria bacterium]|jgi:hypothetical protein|nr:IS4 family transposase [Alphaproteobacteria bacterium]
MVLGRGVSLLQISANEAERAAFGRFLRNPKVTVEGLVEAWHRPTAKAAAGRHVLAIQDTSEITIPTRPGHRRGLGKVGKGKAHGVLLHAMIAVDAATGSFLGPVTGDVWTRRAPVTVPHGQRPLEHKESRRWLETAEAGAEVLSEAERVTVIADRECDLYALWCRLPDGVDLLTRAMHDRRVAPADPEAPVPKKGAPAPTLSTVCADLPIAGRQTRVLRERADRPAREVTLSLRYGATRLARPRNTVERDLPAAVPATVIEVVEDAPPDGQPPLHWRLLTTHAVPDAETAWRIVSWYEQRWHVEQLFRTLKRQGLDVESTQLEHADQIAKLVALATQVAALTMTLVHARDGADTRPAEVAFGTDERDLLHALNERLQGRTEKQRNPHPTDSLAWASWIIARLGGWKNHAKNRPAGPITFKRGIERFWTMLDAWQLKELFQP